MNDLSKTNNVDTFGEVGLSRPYKAETTRIVPILRDSRGFTIIEVLIALTLLAIGVLAAGTMQINSIGGNSYAGNITELTTSTADQLETLMSLPYSDPLLTDDPGGTGNFTGTAGLRNPLPPLGTTQTPNPGLYPPDFATTTADALYTYYWNIAPNSPIANTKTVTVVGVNNTTNKFVVLTGIIPST